MRSRDEVAANVRLLVSRQARRRTIADLDVPLPAVEAQLRALPLAVGAVPDHYDFDPLAPVLEVNATAHPELTECHTDWTPKGAKA